MKGIENIRPYFETEPYISVITEIEILGLKDISKKEISIRQTAIDYCRIIPLTNRIINRAIEIKREIKVAVPDAIIAACAIEEGFSLVTADKGFKRIKNLKLILIDL
jgi:predicted nucleic acid-binding protein